MELDDIVEEFRDCNYDHFDIFYEETKKTVFFALASIVKNKDEVDDLIQDTYVKFLENIGKYKSKTNVKAYLSTMAHNIAINHYNKEKRLVHNDLVFDYIKDDTKEEFSTDIEVVEMLKDLDQISKEIVILHVINELKFKEIASIVDKPLGTVLWIYNKAMKQLRRKVGDSCEE